jgi:HD-GYP domain-containing protein (c-di-GMP phosphodiesterase class II)
MSGLEYDVLILPIEEAKPGMKLAAPVTHPENPNQDLLRQGFVLEDAIILRMRAIGIPFIYVEYPELEILDKHLAVFLTPARQVICTQIRDSMTQVQKQTRAGVPYGDYCDTTRELISTLMTQGQNPIYLDQMSRQGGDAVGHAAAVAHLSLLLGLKLESYIVAQRSRLPPNRAKELVNLGVAGMLHDLGLTTLNESVQKYCEVEPPEDSALREEWETHARVGYELIHNDVEATAAAAVFQHHQHFDGSGFPALKREQGDRETLDHNRIHVFARIIAAANLYDRLSNPAGDKKRRSNLKVMRLLDKQYAGWLDPEIYHVLQSIAPPYPPGCRVRLSDGTRAIVTDVNAAAPTRPTVRRLADDNWTLVGQAIDLRLDGAPQVAAEAA